MKEDQDYLVDVFFDESFMLHVKLQLRYPIPPEVKDKLEVEANKAATGVLESAEYMHSPDLESNIVSAISAVVENYLYEQDYITWGKSDMGTFYRKLLESYPNWKLPGD